MVVEIVDTILSALTMGSHIFLALFLLHGIGVKLFDTAYFDWIRSVWSSLRRYGGYIALAAVATATGGSLFYSEIAGYVPCPLCWWQRIFMYPLVLIMIAALFTKDLGVRKYVVPMSVVGGAISIYHYAIQLSQVAACSGAEADCAVKYTLQFGYISIPLMALTGFVLAAIFVTAWRKR